MNDAWEAQTQEKNDLKINKETEKESLTFCMIWFDLNNILKMIFSRIEIEIYQLFDRWLFIKCVIFNKISVSITVIDIYLRIDNFFFLYI